MIYAYEKISNLDHRRASESAIAILSTGWERRNYPLVDLSKDIPWNVLDDRFRSWNFHVQCWDMLDALLSAHSEGGDEKFLHPSIGLAIDWIERHIEQPQDISPFAWYDMAVGLRSYRLAYILNAADNVGALTPEQRERLWRALDAHRAYLADDANIRFHNNHGLYQVAGQLAMARRFANVSEAMAQAKSQATERLRRMVSAQFAPDGIHLEHSPDYHRMVCDTLRGIVDAGLVEDESIIAFVDKIEESLSWFVLPDQHIANFGDSDYRLVRRKPAEAERKWRTPAMRFMASGGKVGALPDADMAVFREGGYVVVRHSGEQTDDLARASYLAQQAGFHSRTHKHADHLSFIWSDRGANLLVDAGRYGYIGKVAQGSELWKDGHWYEDPNRIYCESTRAHNTLEFDGRNHARKGVKPYGSAVRRCVRTEHPLFAVETEVKHYGSIRHARVLILRPGRWLIVYDWFHDNASEPHKVRQWFHLAPSLAAHADSEGYLVPLLTSDQPLRVTSLLDGPVASRLYLAEADPVMQGWWSGKERDIVPAYAFCYEREDEDSGSFATLFSFSHQLSADRQRSRFNVSGRQGALRWTDEEGEHVLSLSRPAKGELTVEYAVRGRL